VAKRMKKKAPEPAVSLRDAFEFFYYKVESEGLLYAVENYSGDLEKASPEFNAAARRFVEAAKEVEAFIDQTAKANPEWLEGVSDE